MITFESLDIASSHYFKFQLTAVITVGCSTCAAVVNEHIA